MSGPHDVIFVTALALHVDAILKRFTQVSDLRVTVHRPHAPIAATFDGVGACIVRRRHG
jgi:dihydroneopterin aldolase